MRYELPLPLSSLGFVWKERRQALRHWDRFSWQSITWTHYVPYDLQLIREQFSLSVLTSTDQCFEITLTEKHPSALLDIAARYSQGRLLHYAFQELKNATLVSSYIFILIFILIFNSHCKLETTRWPVVTQSHERLGNWPYIIWNGIWIAALTAFFISILYDGVMLNSCFLQEIK